MYVLFLKPISILLCLSRKHSTDYSLVNTAQTKTFDLLSLTRISITEYVSYLSQYYSSVPGCCRSCWCHPLLSCRQSPHGVILEYSLLVLEGPSLTPYSHCPFHPSSSCGLECLTPWLLLLLFSLSEKHFQVFLSPNPQGFREHSWTENSLRVRLENYLCPQWVENWESKSMYLFSLDLLSLQGIFCPLSQNRWFSGHIRYLDMPRYIWILRGVGWGLGLNFSPGSVKMQINSFISQQTSQTIQSTSSWYEFLNIDNGFLPPKESKT